MDRRRILQALGLSPVLLALGQKTAKAADLNGAVFTEVEDFGDTETPCGGDVCTAQSGRQACSFDLGWRGLHWCSKSPVISTAGDGEVAPVIRIRYSKAAIEKKRYVRFRLCETSILSDICGPWWVAKIDNTANAGKTYSVQAPFSYDMCRYVSTSPEHKYWTQAQGTDNADNERSDYKTESGNTDAGTLYCGLAN